MYISSCLMPYAEKRSVEILKEDFKIAPILRESVWYAIMGMNNPPQHFTPWAKLVQNEDYAGHALNTIINGLKRYKKYKLYYAQRYKVYPHFEPAPAELVRFLSCKADCVQSDVVNYLLTCLLARSGMFRGWLKLDDDILTILQYSFYGLRAWESKEDLQAIYEKPKLMLIDRT